MPANKKARRNRTSKQRLEKRSPRKVRPSSLGKPYQKAVKDTETFAAALSSQMKVHGDCEYSLFQAVVRPGEKFTDDSIRNWATGKMTPRWVTSFELLHRIERFYGLPENYFRDKIFPESALRRAVESVNTSQQHVLRWHLPDDFDTRRTEEQQEILSWAHSNVLAGSTEYGKYLGVATQKRYSIRFPSICDPRARKPLITRYQLNAGGDDEDIKDGIGRSSLVEAPPKLAAEIMELVKFKTATIALPGFRRYYAWSDYSAALRVRHFGLIFGAFIASPRSSVGGLGLRLSGLTLAQLIFSTFWDWYLSWRERRRGFLTIFERHIMQEMMSLTRRETGWIRQHPELAEKLRPVTGFITHQDILRSRSNWPNACDVAYNYFKERSREIRHVMRHHRDTFEPIMAVLKSDSPVAEYRKITDEIVRYMPNEALDPLGAAEATRSYLMLRLAMHLGLRQRNLRELLLCVRGGPPRSTFELETKECGEIRWSKRDNGWEVYIPALAFKNSRSSFFQKGPFRVLLPDLEDLYTIINGYVERQRAVLLQGHDDPGTFFVRTVKSDKKSPAYDMASFYAAWRLTIQRYGIYNPYTGRGAIEGLLPHGPHNVRDVLATHVLKHTGSYELAGFAVHDTPEVVRRHYCRFLPEEKTALAAKVLNKVWQAR